MCPDLLSWGVSPAGTLGQIILVRSLVVRSYCEGVHLDLRVDRVLILFFSVSVTEWMTTTE